MNAPEDPLGDGPPDPEWAGFALNVALKLAETFGLGLTLFNALRQRFEGVAASILGDIASTIGAAVRAATGLTTDDLNRSIPLGDLPTVPASWHEGDPGDRILARIDVTGTGTDIPAGETRQVWINALEDMTPADLIEQAQALYELMLNETNPKARALIEEQAAQLVFLAKRF